MRWIERVIRDARTFKLMCVDDKGKRTTEDFRKIGQGAPSLARLRRCRAITFSLKSLVRVDPAVFLEGIGFKPDVVAQQGVYVLRTDEHAYYIPASALLRGLVSIIPTAVDALLTPASMDLRWRPILQKNKLVVETKAGFLTSKQSQAQGISNRLLWLSAYPSARRFWNSVYLNALDGVLDVELPDAEITATLTGVARKHATYVKWMTVATLRPLEKALDYKMKLRSAKFVFDLSHKQMPKSGHHRASMKDEDLVKGCAGWGTSEREWTAIQAVLAEGRRYGPMGGGRESLDAIIRKFGRGLSWTAFHSRAACYYRKLRISGKWDKIKQVLVSIRKEERRSRRTR